MIPVLVIFFREGLEASLIVSIILAYLQRAGQARVSLWVWAGVVGALLADLVVGLSLYHLIRHYNGSRLQTMLEGSTYFVAMVMLTTMSFWMKAQGRDLKRSLEGRVQGALSRGSVWAMTGLSFVTVGREGLETVFFTLAVALRSSPEGVAGGAAIGLGLALGVDWIMLRAGRRVPLSLFFNVMGGVLLVFAAALLSDGIEDFQALGWLPFAHSIWNTAGVLGEGGVLGDILHNFVGYAARPSLLQVGCYVLYLGISLERYFGWSRRVRRTPTKKLPVG